MLPSREQIFEHIPDEYKHVLKDGFCVDLGCGLNKDKRFFGVDIGEGYYVDLQCDIVNDGINLKKDSVDLLYSSHFLEHVGSRLVFVMDEIHRVVKGGGLVVIRVPHFSSLQTEWHNVYCGFRFLQGFCGVDDGLYFVNNGRGEYFVELYRALKFGYDVFDFLFNQYRFSYERFFSNYIRCLEVQLIFQVKKQKEIA